MTHALLTYDPDTTRFAGGVSFPAASLIAIHQPELARLASWEGDFRASVRAIFSGDGAGAIAANVASHMLSHPAPDIREAGARACEQLAAAGDNIARFNVALQLLSGHYFAPDLQKGICLLNLVIDTEGKDMYLKGLAIYTLGTCFCSGVGVPADPVNGHGLYERAAALGVAEAAFNVGLYHDSKDFTVLQGPVDYPKAAAFYMKAAALGYVPAITNLGLLYAGGLVKEPQAGCGWKLLERAGALGDRVAVDAMHALAPGDGTPPAPGATPMGLH